MNDHHAELESDAQFEERLFANGDWFPKGQPDFERMVRGGGIIIPLCDGVARLLGYATPDPARFVLRATAFAERYPPAQEVLEVLNAVKRGLRSGALTVCDPYKTLPPTFRQGAGDAGPEADFDPEETYRSDPAILDPVLMAPLELEDLLGWAMTASLPAGTAPHIRSLSIAVMGEEKAEALLSRSRPSPRPSLEPGDIDDSTPAALGRRVKALEKLLYSLALDRFELSPDIPGVPEHKKSLSVSKLIHAKAVEQKLKDFPSAYRIRKYLVRGADRCGVQLEPKSKGEPSAP